MMEYQQGQLVYNASGMCLGHWCEFCQAPHSSVSCFHPGARVIASLRAELEECKKQREADAKVIHDCRRALGTARDRLMMHEPYTNSIDYEVVKGIEKMLAALAERGE